VISIELPASRLCREGSRVQADELEWPLTAKTILASTNAIEWLQPWKSVKKGPEGAVWRDFATGRGNDLDKTYGTDATAGFGRSR